jgi:hypothetical protein
LDGPERAFVVWSFLYLILLIAHFAVRARFFEAYTVRYGWVMYALAVPAAALSVWLVVAGKDWTLWAAGFLCLAFSLYGFWVDYVAKAPFRSPFVASIGVPYVLLYLATLMFYWWPLWHRSVALWGAYAVLYVVAMVLNLRSH